MPLIFTFNTGQNMEANAIKQKIYVSKSININKKALSMSYTKILKIFNLIIKSMVVDYILKYSHTQLITIKM